MKEKNCSGLIIDLDNVYIKYKYIIDKLFDMFDVPEGELLCDFAIEEAKLTKEAVITTFIPMLVANNLKIKHKNKLKSKMNNDSLNIKYKNKMNVTLKAESKKNKKQLKLLDSFIRKFRKG